MSENSPVTSNSNDLEIYRQILFRILSVFLLVFALKYWAVVVGLGDENLRFDNMPNYWRAAASALIVLMPVAALGLWGGFRWGVVVWLTTALLECLMYGMYPALFGKQGNLLLFHAISVLAYATILTVQSVKSYRASL